MPIIILFIAIPVISLFTALAFYARRPALYKTAWFILLFCTVWFTYSFRGVGLVIPFLVFFFLYKLIRGEYRHIAFNEQINETFKRLKP